MAIEQTNGSACGLALLWVYLQTEGAGGLTWLRADEMLPLAATWRGLIQPCSEMQCLRADPSAKSLTRRGLSLLTFWKKLSKAYIFQARSDRHPDYAVTCSSSAGAGEFQPREPDSSVGNP
jgi:hypothetical protein